MQIVNRQELSRLQMSLISSSAERGRQVWPRRSMQVVWDCGFFW